MPTPDRARARAEEAERLAAVVSYGRDKERLLAQAAEWRRIADEQEAAIEQSRIEAQRPTLATRVQAWFRSRS